ncbi:hypothetical protein HK103_000174 [Boothiomyces macroporosus]|uniref:15-hydroxyprostaglandin dehydrogenase n=1 Tax=Boothiomyces macroporosus TaxID=261099 RepID=A0AAD5Y8Y9_9FUNG|nr:hypothetical protein HK103_000174 [Boothiomyces macroporosus]
MTKPTALVTGLGKALAIRLAPTHNLILCDLNPDPAFMKSLPSAIFVKANVADYKEFEQVFKAGIEKYGEINILVNNAGITESVPFPTSNEEDWKRVVDVDLNGVIIGCRLALDYLSNGVVINVASVAGLTGFAFQQPIYTAVVGLSKSMVLFCKRKGLRVNCICPGFVRTPLVTASEKKGYKTTGNLVDINLVVDGFIKIINGKMTGQVYSVTKDGISLHAFNEKELIAKI